MDCISELPQKLSSSLANSIAHLRIDKESRIPAAVLVPFVCYEDNWHLLFTKRTSDVAKHRGEISFPGGAMETTDDDLIQTAIRESCEEIGLISKFIRVLGTLDPVPTISNFCVLPVVAVVEWPQNLQLNSDEVEKIILIPVDFLLQRENWYEDDFFYEPEKFRKVIHYKDFDGEHLWGLTAAIAQKTLAYLK